MPAGVLYINGNDAYTTWGISLSDTAVSALITPPALKDRITNESRLEHGRRVINDNPKKMAREVTLDMHMTAASSTEFLTRYAQFCSVLENGQLNITTAYQPNVTYKMLYLSCTQYSEFHRQLAKFSLRLLEPNTNDR